MVTYGRDPFRHWPLAEVMTGPRGPEEVPWIRVPTPPLLLSCPGQLQISSYQQEASDQNERLRIIQAGPVSPVHHQTSLPKAGASSGNGGVGICAGHRAGESWTLLPSGSRPLHRWDLALQARDALTMVQLDSLCPFEKRAGIG